MSDEQSSVETTDAIPVMIPFTLHVLNIDGSVDAGKLKPGFYFSLPEIAEDTVFGPFGSHDEACTAGVAFITASVTNEVSELVKLGEDAEEADFITSEEDEGATFITEEAA